MIQPEALKKNEPLFWSPGRAPMSGRCSAPASRRPGEAFKRLVEKDPALARSHYEYRTPLYFAVRENQLEVAAFLLEHGADPINSVDADNLLEIARDRGYAEMEKLLEAALAGLHGASPRERRVAAAIRERDLAKVRSLLDASPELLHAGRRALQSADPLGGDDAADRHHRRAAGARRRHQRPALRWRAPDSAHQRRLPLSRLARCAQRLADHSRDVLAHLRRPRRVRAISAWPRHIGRSGTRARAARSKIRRSPTASRTMSPTISAPGRRCKNAAAGGHLEIVKLLLEHGADPNLPEEGIAPRGHALYSAVYNGHYRNREAPAGERRLPESGSRKLRRRAEHRDHERATEDDRSALLVRRRALRCISWLTTAMCKTAAAVFAANPALADDPDALGKRRRWPRSVRPPDAALPARSCQTRVAGAARRAKSPNCSFKHGMNPNQPNWLRITPLHQFAGIGRSGERRDLHRSRRRSERARRRASRSTPLGWAAKFGKIRDGRVPPAARRQADPARRSALGDAAGVGDPARARRDCAIADRVRADRNSARLQRGLKTKFWIFSFRRNTEDSFS